MVAPGANYSCSLPHHDHGLSYSPKNLHGGTDSSHDKWPHYASLTNVSTQKQLPRAYILRDASTSKPQPAKMSGLAGQAELYTLSLIKNPSDWLGAKGSKITSMADRKSVRRCAQRDWRSCKQDQWP